MLGYIIIIICLIQTFIHKETNYLKDSSIFVMAVTIDDSLYKNKFFLKSFVNQVTNQQQ